MHAYGQRLRRGTGTSSCLPLASLGPHAWRTTLQPCPTALHPVWMSTFSFPQGFQAGGFCGVLFLMLLLPQSVAQPPSPPPTVYSGFMVSLLASSGGYCACASVPDFPCVCFADV